ncbi:2'-5' RNA ligase family protein [Nocardia wallacei]|uniref:2'-5' RNA ligase family protein n=1 Tax=Nocardia wallacei TaxID=480035 RepID=UPI002456ABF6|nr:2'-5' RNA ligase family protein [Nocardia wallacei]
MAAYTRCVCGGFDSQFGQCQGGDKNQPDDMPFPPQLPESTCDVDTVRLNDWTAYMGLSQLEDHWSLKRWVPGYAAYYWYLTFADEKLVALTERCQKILDTAHLDPVPIDRLHLTLLKVGSADSVGDRDVLGLVEAAQQRLDGFASFSLEVGPLAGSPSAVRFSVAPWSQLLHLHRRLRQSVLDYGQLELPRATELFRPHLGIAYNNQPRDAAPMITAVGALRALPPVEVSVNNVTLVRLERIGRQYTWDTCGAIALAR